MEASGAERPGQWLQRRLSSRLASVYLRQTTEAGKKGFYGVSSEATRRRHVEGMSGDNGGERIPAPETDLFKELEGMAEFSFEAASARAPDGPDGPHGPGMETEHKKLEPWRAATRSTSSLT